jgi:hypothetical protein
MELHSQPNRVVNLPGMLFFSAASISACQVAWRTVGPKIWLSLSWFSGVSVMVAPPLAIMAPRTGSLRWASSIFWPHGVDTSRSSRLSSITCRPSISAWSVTARKSSGRRICAFTSSPGRFTGMPRA